MKVVLQEVKVYFDGWWVVESTGRNKDNYCYHQRLRQVSAGEVFSIDRVRAFSPTREQAEEFMYDDHIEGCFDHGLEVYADHCLGCGKWAKVLAFADSGGWAWRVTECKSCGVIDSRTLEQPRLAKCANILERYYLNGPQDNPTGIACPGTLAFWLGDRDAPCNTCGARCGFMVADYEED